MFLGTFLNKLPYYNYTIFYKKNQQCRKVYFCAYWTRFDEKILNSAFRNEVTKNMKFFFKKSLTLIDFYCIIN